MMQNDWQVVIDRCPKGYIELNDGHYATYGPIDRVEINDGTVEIHVEWMARLPLGKFGIPNGKWEVISREPTVFMSFPNGGLPFEIEPTPNKGDRVRFHTMDILYFEAVRKITLEQVEADAVPA
jgi:hypothetical protein